MSSEHPPRLISSERAFAGRVFDVRIDRIAYDDGAVHRLDVVEHGPSYAIVAQPAPDRIVLIRQYRHATGEWLWEIPAGTAEKDEDAAAGAARELREETGYRAGSVVPLGSVYMTPGFCDEFMHFFVARELEAGEQALDEDERISVRVFEWEAAWRLVAAGEIKDAKTVLALLWTRGGKGEIPDGFGR